MRLWMIAVWHYYATFLRYEFTFPPSHPIKDVELRSVPDEEETAL
jgi:hypothetical protein